MPPIAAITGTLRQSAYTTNQVRSRPTETNGSVRLTIAKLQGKRQEAHNVMAVRDRCGVLWRQPGWELQCMDYVDAGGLRIARRLYDFVNDEAVPGTVVEPGQFWQGLGALVRDLAPQNKLL